MSSVILIHMRHDTPKQLAPPNLPKHAARGVVCVRTIQYIVRLVKGRAHGPPPKGAINLA